MKKLVLLFALLFAISAEHQAQAQSVRKKTHKTSTGNTFTVIIPKGKSSTRINAYMLGLAHPVTFIVKVNHGKLLRARVAEMTEPANIRINQIFLPDGSSDGPFSKTLTYPIKRKGTYKIIVGGSKMQGDDWKGAFTMSIRIQ